MDEKEIRPKHYGSLDPEPKTVIENWDLNFNLGNVIKYVSRAGKKPGEDKLEDLKKARTYLDFEIDRVEKEKIKDNLNKIYGAKSSSMYKIGDKIELNEGFTATCQKVENGKAIFLMDQLLKEKFSHENIFKRINLHSTLNEIFPKNVSLQLSPFENAYLFRFPYIQEMFPDEKIWFNFEKKEGITRWELMKDAKNRMSEEWYWLQDFVYVPNFALVDNHGIVNTYGAENALRGIRLVFQIAQ